MLEDLNKGQKIFMVIMYILTGISAILGVFSIYTMMLKKKPFTLGVTYADKIEIKEDEELIEVPIINVSVHENTNNNGLAVYDMRINSYTDTEGNGIAGFGIQCVGDWKIINNSGYKEYEFISNKLEMNSDLQALKDKYGGAFLSNDSGAFGDFYFYYTGDNGEIFHTTTLDSIPDYMLIDIEDKFYRITLKEYNATVLNTSWDAFLPWVDDYKTVRCKFSWFEVFDRVISSAVNSSGKVEYEEFQLNLFDLSDFINIEYLDSTGKYQQLEKTTENKNYFTIYVNYSLNGLVKSSESLFKMVKASPSYNISLPEEIKDYSSVSKVVYITADSFNYKLAGSVYYAYMSDELAEYLSNVKNSEIVFNLSFNNIDGDFVVAGIDLSNITFDLESFTIDCQVAADSFVVLNGENCNIQPTIKVVDYV